MLTPPFPDFSVWLWYVVVVVVCCYGVVCGDNQDKAFTLQRNFNWQLGGV